MISTFHVRGEFPTNEATLDYTAPSLFGLEQYEPGEGLFGRFVHQVVAQDSLVFDRFVGPAARLAWTRSQNYLGYDSIERLNEKGAGLFATIALDSLRNAAIASLPLDTWQEQWQEGLGNFFTGTIGNPEEEHIGIRSISYSAVRSSWERGNEQAGFKWGIRPWRTSPYVYFLTHAGHLEGRPLFTFEGRAGYTLFGSPRLEGRLTLELPGSFRIAGSGAFDLSKIGSNDPGATRCAITLERRLASWRDMEGVLFVGFRVGAITGSGSFDHPRQESLFIVGLSRRW